MAAANDAVAAAIDSERDLPLELLALRAALLGLNDEDGGRAQDAFAEFVEAVENRPFGAWRIGDFTYSNPRGATWRRPSASESATLLRFSDPEAHAHFFEGLARASGQSQDVSERAEALPDDEIEALLFNTRVEGQQTWLVQQDWSQTRTPEGALFQEGAFGPLPQALEGRSDIFEGRLCDRWVWQETELENCQLVVRHEYDGRYAFIGETGLFPFRVAESASALEQ